MSAADSQRKAKANNIVISDKVLCKNLLKAKKLSSEWENSPYTVVAVYDSSAKIQIVEGITYVRNKAHPKPHVPKKENDATREAESEQRQPEGQLSSREEGSTRPRRKCWSFVAVLQRCLGNPFIIFFTSASSPIYFPTFYKYFDSIFSANITKKFHLSFSDRFHQRALHTSKSCSTSSFVLLSVHGIFISLLSYHISGVSNFFSMFVEIFQHSQPYMRTDNT